MRRLLAIAIVATSPAAMAAAAQSEYASDAARFRLETIVEGFQQPVAMTFLPDGHALVADRAVPALYLLDLREQRRTPVTGLPAILTLEDSGLLDVILHPDYAHNGWIYFSYSEGEPNDSTTVVDRARLDGTALVGRERILTANAWSGDHFHYGGRLLFHEGFLYLTVGDRHHQDRAQDAGSHAGKSLRARDD